MQLVVSEGASDLHIRVGTSPTIRVHGTLHRVEGPALTPETSEELMRSLTSEEHIQQVRERGGAEVIQLKDRQIPAEVLSLIPAKVAQMYKCLPVGFANGMLQVALAEPLDPAKADEINFIAKRDVQIVVADPAEIGRAIERLYGQEENESFAEILKELGDEPGAHRQVR